ncbi:hypothetical protein ACGF8B_11830 [Streptomyces sp. NPDC047917]|uniref:hypothetical protein n=1 Tax=Streptomyces sp. NPDC047917 TaxID=3365491 RepID=UPI003712EF29
MLIRLGDQAGEHIVRGQDGVVVQEEQVTALVRPARHGEGPGSGVATAGNTDVGLQGHSEGAGRHDVGDTAVADNADPRIDPLLGHQRGLRGTFLFRPVIHRQKDYLDDRWVRPLRHRVSLRM